MWHFKSVLSKTLQNTILSHTGCWQKIYVLSDKSSWVFTTQLKSFVYIYVVEVSWFLWGIDDRLKSYLLCIICIFVHAKLVWNRISILLWNEQDTQMISGPLLTHSLLRSINVIAISESIQGIITLLYFATNMSSRQQLPFFSMRFHPLLTKSLLLGFWKYDFLYLTGIHYLT